MCSEVVFNAAAAGRQKMFVIARNPIDVFPSGAHLRNTFVHNGQINEQFHVDFPEYWDQFVRDRISCMRKNHTAVLNSIASEIPTFFMRYEDLKLNPVPALTDLFCFLLDVPSIEGTIVERRINEVTEGGFAQIT